MVLFEDKERNSTEPAFHNQNTFDYYNTSARADIEKIRILLNNWFKNYPEEEKHELKARFAKDFDSAFYELFLYNLFIKQGFNVIIHPTIAGTLKRPDFLIKKGDDEFYIEAKTVRDMSQKEEAFERKKNQFYDDLSKVKIMNFYIGLDELIFKSTRQPSTQSLIKLIENKINALDPEALTVLINKEGYNHIPKIYYESDDVKVIINAIPVIPEARNKIIDRPLGILPIETWWGSSEETIRSSITEKAKRYGELNKPYIIAVNALSRKITSTIDVDNAILGSMTFTWSENPNDRQEKWIRQRDGIFLNEKSSRLENLTAVLVTKVSTYNIPEAPYWLYEHPFSSNKSDLSALGLVISRLAGNQFAGIMGNNLGTILAISSDWLKVRS